MGGILEKNGFKKLGKSDTPKAGDVVIMQSGIFKDKGYTGPEATSGHIAIVQTFTVVDKKTWKMTTKQAGNKTSYGDSPITENGCNNVQKNVRWAAFSKSDSRYSFYRKNK